eukprot:3248590-Amphidinium_carterae.1
MLVFDAQGYSPSQSRWRRHESSRTAGCRSHSVLRDLLKVVCERGSQSCRVGHLLNQVLSPILWGSIKVRARACQQQIVKRADTTEGGFAPTTVQSWLVPCHKRIPHEHSHNFSLIALRTKKYVMFKFHNS